jgi:hypothetical protein
MRFGPIPPDQTEDLTLGIPHDPNNNPARRTTVRCRVESIMWIRSSSAIG